VLLSGYVKKILQVAGCGPPIDSVTDEPAGTGNGSMWPAKPTPSGQGGSGVAVGFGVGVAVL
jgi:hypothetical protein